MSRISQSRIAARLQDVVARRREEVGLFREVVDRIQPPSEGCLLEVGCGSGRQLGVTHHVAPALELYGLDLSGEAIAIARKNLESLKVDLRQGTIEATDFDDGFFDLVTCFSSMSYWKNLAACFDEIYRILKPDGAAKLVEPQEDVDIDEVLATIEANLAGESRIRRRLAVAVNRFGLTHGRRLGLTLYSTREMGDLVSFSRFGSAHRIERIALQGLPIFMLITMSKPSDRE